MARVINTEQVKNENKKKTIMILCSVIAVIAVIAGLIAGVVFLVKAFNNKDGRTAVNVNILDEIDLYGYSLSDLDSQYFKEEYYKLKDIIEKEPVDEKEYSTQVARIFAIDLYTMSTKINKYDIGGADYFYRDKKDMFSQKVMDTLYAELLDDTYGDRAQTLPEITNVETISVEETEYTLGENKVNGYLVKLKMTYKEDLGYDKEASIVVCKEEGVRWSVVDFQPTLNPKYNTKK